MRRRTRNVERDRVLARIGIRRVPRIEQAAVSRVADVVVDDVGRIDGERRADGTRALARESEDSQGSNRQNNESNLWPQQHDASPIESRAWIQTDSAAVLGRDPKFVSTRSQDGLTSPARKEGRCITAAAIAVASESAGKLGCLVLAHDAASSPNTLATFTNIRSYTPYSGDCPWNAL